MSKRIYLLTLALLSLPTSAWAAAEGHHGPTLTILWINFVIFCALLFFILRKPITQNWKKRLEDLEDKILRSEKELASAEKRLEDVKSKIAGVDQEIAKLTSNIQEEAKYESLRIEEQVAEQKNRIINQAKISVESEIKGLEKSVHAEFAEKICDLAKDRLKQEFSGENDRVYRTASLGGLNSLIKNKHV